MDIWASFSLTAFSGINLNGDDNGGDKPKNI